MHSYEVCFASRLRNRALPVYRKREACCVALPSQTRLSTPYHTPDVTIFLLWQKSLFLSPYSFTTYVCFFK